MILRTLSPAAAPISLTDIGFAVADRIRGNDSMSRLCSEIREYFSVKHVFLLGSGKEALAVILQALGRLSRRSEVVIPAYTCFSVPSAVVRAGGRVSLCQVDETTLDMDSAGLSAAVSARTLCVVATHLLGARADMKGIRRICEANGAFLVEDAAQAMGLSYEGKMLGSFGDVGFFSLGRGKNLTCGSGGIIVTNNDRIASEIAALYEGLPSIGVLGALGNLALVMAIALCIRPWLYWLPANMPWLRLGETKFEPEFPIQRMDAWRASLLIGWQRRLESANAKRRRTTAQLMARLQRCKLSIAGRVNSCSDFLRLPIILPEKGYKERLCGGGSAKILGISRFYPSGVDEIVELRRAVVQYDGQSGGRIADRLVTLPVHMFVTGDDQERIAAVVEMTVGSR